MRRCSSALLAALIALGGCATKAQQEVSRIQGIGAASAPAIDACWRARRGQPGPPGAQGQDGRQQRCSDASHENQCREGHARGGGADAVASVELPRAVPEDRPGERRQGAPGHRGDPG